MNSLEKNLWGLLQSHLPRKKCDYQRIETGSTGRGIPDVNICYKGSEVWIELKIVKGRKVGLTSEQVAWHYRRARAGGVTWILARDKAKGPRKGTYDKLYLWPGSASVAVKQQGILAPCPHIFTRPYEWDEIIKVLFDGV